MDEVTTVRHRVMVQGASKRGVAREMGISRNTVKRYLKGETQAGKRQQPARAQPVLDQVRARMEALLTEAPQWTTPKQRLTGTQLHRMLVEEGFEVGVSLVKEFVHEWKRKRAEVFVPLVYRPGDLGEVDFFEVFVDLAGKRIKAFMFLLRLMASGRDFAWIFPRQDTTCFHEGHVRAFAHLGGIPHRLAFDNLRLAVKRLLVGSERELTARFSGLVNHFLFEPCFARPATGHDKGGVEARGKGIRLRHLVPIPTGKSLAEISERLMARLDQEASHKKNQAGETVSERFEAEKKMLLPLPHGAFGVAEVRDIGVSRSSLVHLAGAWYSVWSQWAGRSVVAHLGVTEVRLVGSALPEVIHPRQTFGGRSIDYRHYIPELAKKPQALRQVAPELMAALGETYSRLWRYWVELDGPKTAARQFAQVLKAMERQGHGVVAAKIELAMKSGEPVLLALKPPERDHHPIPADQLPAGLRDVQVAQGSAADFDVLLGGVE